MICLYVAACFKQRSCCIPETARLWLAICVGSIFFLLESTASADTIHVDNCSVGSGAGSQSNPHTSLATAIAAAEPGDALIVQAGAYPDKLRIRKTLTIVADGGPVLIGKYYTASAEVCVPISEPHVGAPPGTCALPDDPQIQAKIYYPSATKGGTRLACGGPFPAVVYAHGLRHGSMELCPGSSPGEIHEDYRQAEGIVSGLAAAGIVVISADNSWGRADTAARGSIVIETIAYLRDENLTTGSQIEGGVDMQRMALLGHSKGGSAAVYAALNLRDPRFSSLALDSVEAQALVLIAPAFEPSVIGPLAQNIPTLVIHGTNEHDFQVGDGPVKLYAEANASKHLAVVVGANHFGYTDDICLNLDDGQDNPSEVGGVTGEDAHFRQRLTARNYVHAFLSHYLQGAAGLIDHLVQNQGQQCEPGVPPACGRPRRSFENLDAFDVEVGVCSCLISPSPPSCGADEKCCGMVLDGGCDGECVPEENLCE